MNDFLRTSLSFPTLLYSILLVVCLVYWLLAATGLADSHDSHDLPVGDGHGHGNSLDHDSEGLAGILGRFGLSGVPLMVILTVLSLVGWLGTYFVHLLLLAPLPTMMRLLIGAAVAVGMLVPGVFLTSLLLRPVSKLILRLRPPADPSILGRVATVSTPTVDAGYGQATVDDGGAGLVLQIRHEDPERFKRGDRVVLIEYVASQHAYRVISEQQFNTL
ncbi:OB-fold-containig protein [Luteimonas aquatica]|uniref:OB-fold-containig protein n=1 Tax=Luteimonas aquatica TaxID=450364 RepID=UPI001F56AD38|nr:OB-fold-containig protein [Luteimonas aquatica]